MLSTSTQNGLFAVIADELQAVEDRLQAPEDDSGALLRVVANTST